MYQRDSSTIWKLILLQYGLFDKSQILILSFRELMHRRQFKYSVYFLYTTRLEK